MLFIFGPSSTFAHKVRPGMVARILLRMRHKFEKRKGSDIAVLFVFLLGIHLFTAKYSSKLF